MPNESLNEMEKDLIPFGLLHFPAPILATFLIFQPMGGAGYFGLKLGWQMFAVYLFPVNVPFGIMTTLAARGFIGKKP